MLSKKYPGRVFRERLQLRLMFHRAELLKVEVNQCDQTLHIAYYSHVHKEKRETKLDIIYPKSKMLEVLDMQLRFTC